MGQVGGQKMYQKESPCKLRRKLNWPGALKAYIYLVMDAQCEH